MDKDEGWTLKTQREYFLKILKERDKNNAQRFEAQALAVTTALETMNERLGSMNEFRKTIEDQQNKFMQKGEATALFNGLQSQVTILVTQGAKTEGRGAGRNDIWGILVTVISAAIAIGAVIFRLK